ncbi:hypothetical protein [Sphingobacterium prati]|uniref:hypothetical protein n=1 Tax=Sphingobacterium prati TaxID=2737006 RepID=UPI001552B798|nr:hypothetical protein [Sphingobacterium prati]NPE44893.1 hypothetical protein [Sphingobacterium prati]
MEKLNNLDLELLSDSEILSIDGGGFFRDLGFAIGYAFGSFAKAQERELDGGLGGPTANHF